MNKSQIRKELYELPKHATFQVDKILSWIKHNQEVSRSLGKDIRMNVSGAIAKRSMRDGNKHIGPHPLRPGDWSRLFNGKDKQNLTK